MVLSLVVIQMIRLQQMLSATNVMAVAKVFISKIITAPSGMPRKTTPKQSASLIFRKE